MRTSRIFLLGLAMVLFAGNCFAQRVFEVGSWRGLQLRPVESVKLSVGYHCRYKSNIWQWPFAKGRRSHFHLQHHSWIGIKADLQGLDSNTSQFLIPAGNAFVPKGGAFTVSGDLFTYTFGPEVKFRARPVQPIFSDTLRRSRLECLQELG